MKIPDPAWLQSGFMLLPPNSFFFGTPSQNGSLRWEITFAVSTPVDLESEWKRFSLYVAMISGANWSHSVRRDAQSILTTLHEFVLAQTFWLILQVPASQCYDTTFHCLAVLLACNIHLGLTYWHSPNCKAKISRYHELLKWFAFAWGA